jgi:hypothetical protein
LRRLSPQHPSLEISEGEHSDLTHIEAVAGNLILRRAFSAAFDIAFSIRISAPQQLAICGGQPFVPPAPEIQLT